MIGQENRFPVIHGFDGWESKAFGQGRKCKGEAIPEVPGFFLFADGSHQVKPVLHSVTAGFRSDNFFVIRIQDTCNDQFIVISDQEAGEDMKILFWKHGTQAEDKSAGGAVAGLVKCRKFIDIASIVNDFRGAVPQAKAACHGGESELGNTDDVVGPVNAGLYLAESFFYFGGFFLLFHKKVQIMNGQNYPGVAGRRKQTGILVGAVPETE